MTGGKFMATVAERTFSYFLLNLGNIIQQKDIIITNMPRQFVLNSSTTYTFVQKKPSNLFFPGQIISQNGRPQI